jgi:two-component system response regulator RegX3
LIVVDDAFACEHPTSCVDQLRELSEAPIMAIGEIDEEQHPALELALPADAAPNKVAERGVALIHMRRPAALPQPIRWGGLELDMRTHQARWNGSLLPLTTLQYRIMEVLILAAGAVVTSEQLARRVWGDSSFDDRERLTAHVRRIRKLIEDDPSLPEFLLRVRGVGFRLADPVDSYPTEGSSARSHL